MASTPRINCTFGAPSGAGIGAKGRSHVLTSVVRRLTTAAKVPEDVEPGMPEWEPRESLRPAVVCELDHRLSNVTGSTAQRVGHDVGYPPRLLGVGEVNEQYVRHS
jgi:hypothetical protein